jgi:hypothetical protein
MTAGETKLLIEMLKTMKPKSREARGLREDIKNNHKYLDECIVGYYTHLEAEGEGKHDRLDEDFKSGTCPLREDYAEMINFMDTQN